MTSQEVIKIAQGEIGTREYPANSNNVKYNTWYYGHPVSGSAYPWCCVFIEWLLKGTNLLTKTASCSNLYSWFKKNNQAVTNPQKGDICFFKFSTNPSHLAEHVGIVSNVANGKVYTIEGNTSASSNVSDNGGIVWEHARSLTSKNIVGYGRPKYDGSAVISTKKSNEEIAQEVIQGKWGTGADRKQKLTQAGYNPNEIQKIVNEMLK